MLAEEDTDTEAETLTPGAACVTLLTTAPNKPGSLLAAHIPGYAAARLANETRRRFDVANIVNRYVCSCDESRSQLDRHSFPFQSSLLEIFIYTINDERRGSRRHISQLELSRGV